jgi:hypothetical protein
VTVHATDFTALQLGLEYLETRAAFHPGDHLRLSADVVELQDDRIRFTAIDAGVCSQVINDEREVALLVASAVRIHVRDVLRTVLAVPTALTFPAVELETHFPRTIEGARRK